MASIEFTIEGSLPGLNEIIAMNRVSSKSNKKRFYAYTEIKRKVEEKIVLSAMSANRSRSLEPLASFDAHFLWFERNSRRDPDNVAAGVKFIFDALVSCKLIAGDRFANVRSIHHHFMTSKENPRVEVELREI